MLPCDKMSRIFVVAFFLALASTVSPQCSHNSFGCNSWQEMLQQSRTKALAQRLVSKMSLTKTQMMICRCCCAETPCISSEICRCVVEECYAHILGKCIIYSIYFWFLSLRVKNFILKVQLFVSKQYFIPCIRSWNHC